MKQLYFGEGLSTVEIARRSNVPKSTVVNRLRRIAPLRAANAEKFADIPDKEFTERYIREGRSARKTGKFFGMSPAAAQHRCNKLGLRPLYPRIEDKAQKREALLDPGWEARQALADAPIRPVDVFPSQDLFDLYTRRVLCRECFRLVSAISSPMRTRNSHLWKHFPECSTHEERVEKYKKLHPGARLFPIAHSAEQRGREGRHPDVRKFAEEFVALYVTAAELIERRKDPEQWAQRDGDDLWICLECGRKLGPQSDPYLHIPVHGYNAESYRMKWPAAPLSTPVLRLKGRNDSTARRVRIRAKLAEIPTLQEEIAELQEKLRLLEAIKNWQPNDQAVARLLIDDSTRKNEAIGVILDDRRTKCPWGSSWERELKRGTGAKWISLFRDRLRKLGLEV